MSDELKPCPFCGSMATIHCDIPRFHAYGYGVGCSNPNCAAYSGYGMMTCETKEEAIDAWNRRAERHAKRIIVANGATGHCKCGACGGLIGAWDNYCKHCGARLEVER